METSFKISKKGKYIQIDYISNLELKSFKSFDYIWSISIKDAKEFLRLAREIETKIKTELVSKNLNYDYRLIMVRYLKVIDGISTGFDIRSKMTTDELAENFVWWYDKKYTEEYNYCKEVMDYYEAEGKNNSYMSNWRKYDEFNDKIKEFNLPFKSLTRDSFKEDELRNMSDALDMLHKLIDERKNENANNTSAGQLD